MCGGEEKKHAAYRKIQELRLPNANIVSSLFLPVRALTLSAAALYHGERVAL
jgi:hypothetical protein